VNGWVILLATMMVILLLRIRLRFRWEKGERELYVGILGTGLRWNLRGMTEWLLLGYSVRRREAGEEDSPPEDPEDEPAAPGVRKSLRQLRLWGPLARPVISAAVRAGSHLWRGTRVEQLEGEVDAGFDDPATTGMAYGWLQAVSAVTPTIFRRLEVRPVWDRAAFSASMRASAAVPLYRLVSSGWILLRRLPLVRLWRASRAQAQAVE
jgi:hypothetical protein